MSYILGIDIGTTNTKAVGYAMDGSVVTRANAGYSFVSPREGYHELSPQELLDAVRAVIRQSVASMGKEELIGVSFSAAMHGIMAVDDAGRPLTNMITWADLRSAQYAEALKNSPQGKRIYERTGTPIHAMSPLSKLLWMKSELPQVFQSAARFISIKEFVFWTLFGSYVIDWSIASATGLFDIYTKDWNDEALATAGISRQRLSEPVPVTFAARGLSSEEAVTLGIADSVPFIIGGSDGSLAHIGSNAVNARDVSLTIGTSGAVRMLVQHPVADEHERFFNYIVTDNLYVAGGPLNSGGNVVHWFNKNMTGAGDDSASAYAAFFAQAANVPAGGGGLIFLPYIYGERAPVWDAQARGLFFGINGSHTQAHFMRAVLEGICYAVREVFVGLEELMGPSRDVYVSGGFLHSPLWVQLLADVLGKRLLVTATEDASAAGAAALAMVALDVIGSLEEATAMFKVTNSFEPDASLHATYMSGYNIYSQLYAAFKTIKK